MLNSTLRFDHAVRIKEIRCSLETLCPNDGIENCVIAVRIRSNGEAHKPSKLALLIVAHHLQYPTAVKHFQIKTVIQVQALDVLSRDGMIMILHAIFYSLLKMFRITKTPSLINAFTRSFSTPPRD